MERLKLLRKKANLRQIDVAKAIGISQNNYSYWENGKVKIDDASLIKLARLFNVSVGYLLGHENTLSINNDNFVTPTLYNALAKLSKNEQEFIYEIIISMKKNILT